jgi:DNA gyrase subunit A
LPIRDFSVDAFVFMAATSSTVKRRRSIIFTTAFERSDRARSRTRQHACRRCTHRWSLRRALISSLGKAARFEESDVRTMGRTARGVRGIRLTGAIASSR